MKLIKKRFVKFQLESPPTETSIYFRGEWGVINGTDHFKEEIQLRSRGGCRKGNVEVYNNLENTVVTEDSGGKRWWES